MPKLLIQQKTPVAFPGKDNEGFGIIVINAIRQNRVFRIYKHYIIDSIMIVRRNGFKELIRQRGRRFLLIIFTYYLVRDALVYVFIPYCIAQGIL